MARIARLFPPVLSAILFQISFPPTNIWFCAFFCLVPWMLQLRASTLKQTFWLSYLMGFLIVLGQMAWLQSFVDRWTDNLALSIAPWIVCGFLGAFYFALAGILIRAALLRRWWWAVPLIWAGIEIFRSYVPALAFPWFILATPLWRVPAIDQWAFVGTIYFVSGWVCLINLLLTSWVAGWKGRALRWSLAAAVVMPALSLLWYLRPINGEPKRILASQPGYDMAFGDKQSLDYELSNRVRALETRAREQHAGLLVLPEGMSDSAQFPPSTPFELPQDIPILFGGRRGTMPQYQTAFAYDHGKWSYADKSRLVVFGEYVPGRDYIPFLSSFKVPAGDLRAAEKVSAVNVAGMKVGPLICFEALFWDVAHAQSQNGVQMLAVMSLDDWYMATPAPEQLKVGTVWRAIETGLPVVRSASLGYTLAVDQRGRVLGEAPVGHLNYVVADLRIEKEPLKNPARAVFPWLGGFFPFGFLVFVLISRRRNHRTASPVPLSNT